jgi:site-specific recombinase XerD
MLNPKTETLIHTRPATKNGEQRFVIFKKRTVPYLIKYIESCNIKKHLIINLETRFVLHTDSIQTICQRIQDKANIEQSITPHKWRHTFASRFNENNGNTFVLMKLLGHKDIKTTQRYVTVSLDTIKNEYIKILENEVK